ncbi:MAG: helix-turn-helix domain-containing protein [Thermohalobaculum sp.]
MIGKDIRVGRDIRAWRKCNKYQTQADLQEELGVKSRGTISAWENSDEPIPRTLHLALEALERLPDLRQVLGRRMTAKEKAALKIRS